MDLIPFVARRIAMQLRRLRSTGHSLTVDIGDVYYQLASYDANQLLVEVSSNQFLPHGAGLDGIAQKALAAAGFTAPEEDWPNWHIKLEDPTSSEMIDAAIALTAALLEVYRVPLPDLLNGLLDEFARSHPDYRIDPEWVETLVGDRAYS